MQSEGKGPQNASEDSSGTANHVPSGHAQPEQALSGLLEERGASLQAPAVQSERSVPQEASDDGVDAVTT